MRVFITGTDPDIGKTTVASWLCLHTQAHYFKPIQTGAENKTDSQIVAELSGTHVYREAYLFPRPVSPHVAARLVHQKIELSTITLPPAEPLIVEGAGGLLVPLNEKEFIIDLITHLKIPVILTASTRLGTINHTLLSLEALRARKIPILGVILVGDDPLNNTYEIETYGKIAVLAQLPFLSMINKEILQKIPFTKKLKHLFRAGIYENIE